MKSAKLCGILLLSLLAISMASCSNEDEKQHPITLEYEDSQVIFDNEGRAFALTPFSSETQPLHIKGGDGNYKVTNENEEAVRVNYDGEKISFQPLKLGLASIRIEDSSNNTYILTINVKYRDLLQGVVQRRYIIQGDDITVGNKAKLEKAMQAADLIERYAFTFTNKEESKGTVRLYSKGSESKAYAFESEHIILSEEDAIILIGNTKLRDYYRITIKEEAGDNTFYITKNFFPLIGKDTRMSNDFLRASYCFIKDLTELYQTTYPEMEHAYRIQVVGTRY